MALASAALILLSTLPLDLPGDLQVGGFLQGLYGQGLDPSNPTANDQTAVEARGQLRAERISGNGEFFGRLDFAVDHGKKTEEVWELREAHFKLRLGRSLDIKIGRQIITWGTGDSIFINDVFAKDFESFFVGRDDQYLKAPQDAFRAEAYLPAVGVLSLVWTPLFEPNRLPDGKRLSFYSPFAGVSGGGGGIVGDGFGASPPRPARTTENSEIAARLSKQFGSFNAALYGYRGFYKNPVGFAPGADFPAGPDFGTPTYPELGVYGASLQGTLLQTLFWLEGGYFDSLEDPDGDDAFLPNSSASALVGVERAFASVLTLNAQWQGTWMFDHDLYEQQQTAAGFRVRDELHSLLATRLQLLLLNETVRLSTFLFFSPDEEDVHGRLSVAYNYTDEVTATVGANVFHGSQSSTDFGQFKKNDNVYLKVTYGF